MDTNIPKYTTNVKISAKEAGLMSPHAVWTLIRHYFQTTGATDAESAGIDLSAYTKRALNEIVSGVWTFSNGIYAENVTQTGTASAGVGDFGVKYLSALLDVEGAGWANGEVLVYNSGTSKWEATAYTSGVVDHGALTGLGDDDHTQYHTNARGDLRYELIIPSNTYEPYDTAITKSDEAEVITAEWQFSGGDIVIGTDDTISWGAAKGKLSWDTGKAYVYGLSGNTMQLGADGSIDDLIISTSGAATFKSTCAATSFIEGGTTISDKYEPKDSNITKDNESETVTGLWKFQGTLPLEFTGQTTGYQYTRFVTTGGNYILGVASSSGTGLFSGASNYSMQLGSEGLRDLHLGTNNAVRVTVNGTTGAVTAVSTMTATNFIQS